MTLAIVCAMPQELAALCRVMSCSQRTNVAGREVLGGRLEGHDVVVAQSGIGKVAAATTATLLLASFDVSALFLTGVAGGLGAAVRVGDVVIARELLQHDMDVSPLWPRFVVPHAGRSRFPTDRRLADDLVAAATAWTLDAHVHLGAARLARHGIAQPRVHEGLVVSGDRFVATAQESAALRAALPDALAVEMEGAAVAQVCADFGCPCAVLRIVSDRADDAAHGDFSSFVDDIASDCTLHLASAWLRARAAT